MQVTFGEIWLTFSFAELHNPRVVGHLMRIGGSFIYLFVLALPARAGTITQATCSFLFADGGTLTASSPSSCAVSDIIPPPSRTDVEARASASHSYFPFTSTTELRGETFIHVEDALVALEAGVVENSASAASMLILSALTVGPTRPGLIELLWAAGTAYGIHAQSTASWDVGGYSGNVIADSFFPTCIGPPGATLVSGDAVCGMKDPILLPFQLGAPFDMGFQINAGPYSGGDGTPRETGLNLFVGFRLTELDGTPVDVHLVPEPAAWVLIGLGLSALLAFRAFHAILRRG